VGDFYVSVIPTDATWQPARDAATAAGTYIRQAFPDLGGSSQQITVEFYDRITAVDPGEDLEQITCPRCDSEISLDWYADLVERDEGEFDTLDVTVPCCGAALTLDALHYDWPCGFTRFEIAIANPVRAEVELTSEELEMAGKILGHAVRQILIHI
jgi:hypothetical protein